MSRPIAPALALSPHARAALDGEYANMLACIRCGLCLTSCPTYVLTLQEAEGPRGRIALARGLAEGRIELTPDLIRHEQNCLVCDACSAVCPAGVHMDPIQVVLRQAIEESVQRSEVERTVRAFVFDTLFANMRWFRWSVRLLYLYQHLGLNKVARSLGILRVLGLVEAESILPTVHGTFLIPRGEVYPARMAAPSNSGSIPHSDERGAVARATQDQNLVNPSTNASMHERKSAERTVQPAVPSDSISFFAGCVMSTALADVDRATIRVLQRCGCTVTNVAGQGCCGALHAHGGDLEGMRALARENIAAFEKTGNAPIVNNAAGCGAMLKDYGHHLADDPIWAERAKRFSARVRDASEVAATRPLAMTKRIDARITFQDPCHLIHAQRIRQQPRTLLGAIPGVTIAEMAEPALCCGSAGIYNVTNPREATQLGDRKVTNALAAEPDLIVTANPGCMFQLRSGLAKKGSRVQVRHLFDVLDEASAPLSSFGKLER